MKSVNLEKSNQTNLNKVSLYLLQKLSEKLERCQTFYGLPKFKLLRSEIPSGKCAKLRTAAASNNRDHASQSLIISCSRHAYILLFFAHIPFVVNHTINATPPERLQQNIFQTYVETLVITFIRCICQLVGQQLNDSRIHVLYAHEIIGGGYFGIRCLKL